MGLILSYISSASVVIPLLLGIFYFFKIDRSYKVLALLVLSGSITESLLYILFNMNTMFILNLYTVIEFVLLTSYFGLQFEKSINKWVAVLASIAFTVSIILPNDIILNFEEISSISMIVESISMIVMSILLLMEMINRVKENYYTEPETWVILGLITYFGGNLFTFGFSSSYFDQNFPFDLWITHSMFNVVLNISIAIAFYLAGSKRNSVSE